MSPRTTKTEPEQNVDKMSDIPVVPDDVKDLLQTHDLLGIWFQPVWENYIARVAPQALEGLAHHGDENDRVMCEARGAATVLWATDQEEVDEHSRWRERQRIRRTRAGGRWYDLSPPDTDNLNLAEGMWVVSVLIKERGKEYPKKMIVVFGVTRAERDTIRQWWDHVGQKQETISGRYFSIRMDVYDAVVGDADERLQQYDDKWELDIISKRMDHWGKSRMVDHVIKLAAFSSSRSKHLQDEVKNTMDQFRCDLSSIVYTSTKMACNETLLNLFRSGVIEIDSYDDIDITPEGETWLVEHLTDVVVDDGTRKPITPSSSSHELAVLGLLAVDGLINRNPRHRHQRRTSLESVGREMARLNYTMLEGWSKSWSSQDVMRALRPCLLAGHIHCYVRRVSPGQGRPESSDTDPITPSPEKKHAASFSCDQ